MKAKKWFLMLFIITVIQFSGCSLTQQTTSADKLANVVSVTPSPEITPRSFPNEYFENEWKGKYEDTSADLERNRRLWQESKIVNYDFVAARYAGGVTNGWNRSPVLIKVREGEKNSIEVVSKSDKTYMARIDGFEDFDTIDKLFNYLRQQLDKGKIIDVDYNKKLGYPGKNISIMDSFETHGTRNIVIEKFEIIE